MMKNENQDKNENGLPEVAEDSLEHKLFWGSIFGVIVAGMIVMYLLSPGKSENKIVIQEENYTVQNDAHFDHKEEVSVDNPESIPEVVSAPPVNQEVIQQQLELLQAKQKELQQRLAAPLMLVNVSQSNSPNVTAQDKKLSGDTNTAFMQQISSPNTEANTATTIGSLNTIIAEGSLIHAILESAANSDLPGMLRASVSEPVYAEDGSQILIPVGSRLIGQYKSGLVQGQSRFFTVWTRLITPTGISIQLGSPGVDSLAVAGMDADEVDRHFWERFGSASLLSLIGAGASNLGVSGEDQNNSASSYREAVANSFAQSASQSLQQDNRIAPTLKKYQGKPIMVFVAKDLHFENAMKAIKPKLNVF